MKASKSPDGSTQRTLEFAVQEMRFTRRRTLGKRCERFSFGEIDRKDREQVGGFQNALNERRYLAELQIATVRAQHAHQSNQRAQAATIQVADLG